MSGKVQKPDAIGLVKGENRKRMRRVGDVVGRCRRDDGGVSSGVNRLSVDVAPEYVLHGHGLRRREAKLLSDTFIQDL